MAWLSPEAKEEPRPAPLNPVAEIEEKRQPWEVVQARGLPNKGGLPIWDL